MSPLYWYPGSSFGEILLSNRSDGREDREAGKVWCQEGTHLGAC